MAELKPCPFCGGEAAFLGTTCTIKCKQCGGAFIATNPVMTKPFGGYKWTVKDGRVVNLLVAIENGGDNDAADQAAGGKALAAEN